MLAADFARGVMDKKRKWQNETQSNYHYQNGNLLSFEILINRKKSCVMNFLKGQKKDDNTRTVTSLTGCVCVRHMISI